MVSLAAINGLEYIFDQSDGSIQNGQRLPVILT